MAIGLLLGQAWYGPLEREWPERDGRGRRDFQCQRMMFGLLRSLSDGSQRWFFGL